MQDTIGAIITRTLRWMFSWAMVGAFTGTLAGMLVTVVFAVLTISEPSANQIGGGTVAGLVGGLVVGCVLGIRNHSRSFYIAQNISWLSGAIGGAIGGGIAVIYPSSTFPLSSIVVGALSGCLVDAGVGALQLVKNLRRPALQIRLVNGSIAAIVGDLITSIMYVVYSNLTTDTIVLIPLFVGAVSGLLGGIVVGLFNVTAWQL